MIGRGLELVRPGGGRNYELTRDGEVVGTVHRRGVFRPRYTAVIGDNHWRILKPRSYRVSVVDESSGEEIAVLDDEDAEGYELFVHDAAEDVESAPIILYDDREHAFTDDSGARLLSLRGSGAEKGVIGTIRPGERPWPSADPDASVALALAILVVRHIAERDAS